MKRTLNALSWGIRAGRVERPAGLDFLAPVLVLRLPVAVDRSMVRVERETADVLVVPCFSAGMER